MSSADPQSWLGWCRATLCLSVALVIGLLPGTSPFNLFDHVMDRVLCHIMGFSYDSACPHTPASRCGSLDSVIDKLSGSPTGSPKSEGATHGATTDADLRVALVAKTSNAQWLLTRLLLCVRARCREHRESVTCRSIERDRSLGTKPPAHSMPWTDSHTYISRAWGILGHILQCPFSHRSSRFSLRPRNLFEERDGVE